MGVSGLLFMIARLIALSAGNAIVIEHPSRDGTLALVLMLFGGRALFLPARGLVPVASRRPRPRPCSG
jgi:low temperature requirement protein LtrA